MHKHWDQNLNLKSFIEERRPKVIVECGIGEGHLTKKLAPLLDQYPCSLYAVSDNEVEGLDDRIIWRNGISYQVLETFDDQSIDLCIIDTDHNYWTLMKELAAVFNKIKEGGMIALHDVETFYHDTGMAMSYWNDIPYPKEEIEKWAKYGSLGDALIWFLKTYPFTWKLLGYNKESHGAAVIEKRTRSIFSVVKPGNKPIFAKEVIDV